MSALWPCRARDDADGRLPLLLRLRRLRDDAEAASGRLLRLLLLCRPRLPAEASASELGHPGSALPTLAWVRRVSAVLATSLAVLVAASCGGTGGSTEGGSDRLTKLSNLTPISDAFNADKGKPRLVLLFSPT